MKIVLFTLTAILLAFTLSNNLTEPTMAEPIAQPTSSPQTIKLTEADDGKAIALKVKQRFTLTLPENPSTGYLWSVVPNKTQIVKVEDSQYQAEQPIMPGSPGQRIFTFVATKPGKTDLQLNYQRPWESSDSAAEQFHLKIQVLKGN